MCLYADPRAVLAAAGTMTRDAGNVNEWRSLGAASETGRSRHQSPTQPGVSTPIRRTL